MKRRLLRKVGVFVFGLIALILVAGHPVSAIQKKSVSSGNWNDPATWNPAGIPLAGDDISILAGHTIVVAGTGQTNDVTISANGRLLWQNNHKLIVHGNFIVDGTAEIVNGDIELPQNGQVFKIGPAGILTWEPANNTSTGASLFLNGSEDFHPTSTLIIRKWFNYTAVPLAQHVTGDFGNVSLSTLTSGLLYEWNQNNLFETHKILGTLTIDQGWIVLDKSGSISNTTIGAVYLKTINAYLDLHSGDHSGSFTLNTSSVTNIGGTLNGIYNGDGNITVKVDNDFINLGYVELIYNSGVTGKGNGNATLEVGNKFRQTAGDFRGIFNLSSTNTGFVNLKFKDVEITGGIFMGQYACHTFGGTSTIQISGDLNIDFTNHTSKFRGNGLTSLSGTPNTLKLSMIVDGNVTIKGNAGAEITTSGSSGVENVAFKGVVNIEGCTVNSNFGSHPAFLKMFSDVNIKGGTTYLSRTDGHLSTEIFGDLNVSGGLLAVKGSGGNANLSVIGKYNQTGGNVFLHYNSALAATSIVYMTVYNDFLHSGGVLSYDDNPGGNVSHHISLNGPRYVTSGTALITSASTPSNYRYGYLYFDRPGIIEYLRIGNTANIQQIKQVVSSGSTLKPVNSDILVTSSSVQVPDLFRIASSGVLDLGPNRIFANQGIYSSIIADDNSLIKTSRPQGLYNGTDQAAISSAGNMHFTLDPFSTVEYNGSVSQVITGKGIGTAQQESNEYGILRINNTRGGTILSPNVIVRTGLDLINGELNMNTFPITIKSGKPSAITSNNGYIRSENDNASVTWKNLLPGNFTIPFGINNSKKIPVSFSPVSGFGSYFSVSTRGCTSDNRPLAAGVSNIDQYGKDVSITKVIDRWYHITAPGVSANLDLSYSGLENTTKKSLALKNFSMITWVDGRWSSPFGNGDGVISGTGSVNVTSNSTWGPMLLISHEHKTAADLLSFTAELKNNKVDLEWITLPGAEAEYYTIERSEDGITFRDLMIVNAAVSSLVSETFTETDTDPLDGMSYYRIRQTVNADTEKYSNVESISNFSTINQNIEIDKVFPNPFSQQFTVDYSLPEDGYVEINMISSSGQQVYRNNISVSKGNNRFVLPLEVKLENGIYFLSITSGKRSKSIKLIKI